MVRWEHSDLQWRFELNRPASLSLLCSFVVVGVVRVFFASTTQDETFTHTHTHTLAALIKWRCLFCPNFATQSNWLNNWFLYILVAYVYLQQNLPFGKFQSSFHAQKKHTNKKKNWGFSLKKKNAGKVWKISHNHLLQQIACSWYWYSEK